MEHYSTVQNNDRLQRQVMLQTSNVKHIGIALFNGFALPEAASVIEIFQAANALAETRKLARTRYDVRLLSATGGRVASSSSVFVYTESIEARQQADKLHALFIAGGADLWNTLHDVNLIRWLRRASHGAEHVCLPFGENPLLEATGLTKFITDGNPEPGCGDVGRKPRSAKLSHDATVSLRLALGVVQDDLGSEIAQQIAARTQPLAETPFTTTVRKNTSALLSKQIQAAAQWLESHGDQPVSIGDAAQVAAMSERNFLRRFKIEVGLSPSDYLLKVRLDLSCRLLVETSLPVDKIARRCGIGTGGQLSKLFRKHLATTPTEYRANGRQLHGLS
ncbi:GlxA family transcriptional regulator [Paraburkholderia lacunae]|uniref:AraC family transcriptional regulator n=1 Tax=Paraburkholderia lacunae TaxID=2211104 RepID=A0A370NE16_9BURK|nr:helix-turn-helix domain-containing protein [Paraburkholderia lacunae]RDK03841.1 AraC family transcriptional regulator [Paraburkholderia lacunae]